MKCFCRKIFLFLVLICLFVPFYSLRAEENYNSEVIGETEINNEVDVNNENEVIQSEFINDESEIVITESNDIKKTDSSNDKTLDFLIKVFYVLKFIGILFLLFIIRIIIEFIDFAVKDLIHKSADKGYDKKVQKNVKKIKLMSDDEVTKIDPTINAFELEDYVFDLYRIILKSFMNYDSDKLRSRLSDELFDSYKNKLDSLKTNGQKHVFENITNEGSYFYKIEKNENYEIVTMLLFIKASDYILDSNNKIISGSKKPVSSSYLITLERSLKSEDRYCPNCGSELNEYSFCCNCDSYVYCKVSDFVMINEEKYYQK